MDPSPSPPVHLVPFARSVIQLLTIWPALQLSFEQSATHQSQNSQDSARSELATELVGAFLDAQPSDQETTQGPSAERPTPDQEDIEDFLLGWIFGTLDVRIEDESEISISRDLISLWNEWSLMTHPDDEQGVRSQGPVIQRIERVVQQRRDRGSRIMAQLIDEGRLSDNDESDNDDDMKVDEPASQQAHTLRRPSPIVDEDGFTLITRSSQRH